MISLDINWGKFEKDLLNCVRQHINEAMVDSLDDIKVGVGVLFEEKLKSSPAYDNLVGGLLRADLGLANPESYLQDIIETIKANIEIKYSPMSSSGTGGGISVWLIRSSYRDIFSLPDSKFVSSGGYLIEWLKWMLIKGGDVLITDYVVSYGDYPASRSGEALMFKKSGGIYKIPSQFSGVPGKNFLTRAIDSSASDFAYIFEKCLGRYL